MGPADSDELIRVVFASTILKFEPGIRSVARGEPILVADLDAFGGHFGGWLGTQYRTKRIKYVKEVRPCRPSKREREKKRFEDIG